MCPEKMLILKLTFPVIIVDFKLFDLTWEHGGTARSPLPRHVQAIA
jgi:hypothetical protein